MPNENIDDTPDAMNNPDYVSKSVVCRRNESSTEKYTAIIKIPRGRVVENPLNISSITQLCPV